jgi:hypothetical protein
MIVECGDGGRLVWDDGDLSVDVGSDQTIALSAAAYRCVRGGVEVDRLPPGGRGAATMANEGDTVALLGWLADILDVPIEFVGATVLDPPDGVVH